MTILFFEPHITGHRQEYLNHLIEYVSANPSGHEYIFVVHPDFQLQTKSTKVTIEKVSSPRSLSPRRRGAGPRRIKRNFASALTRSLRTYLLAHHYAKLYRADHLCFLNFNDVQFALAIFRPKYTISGILFKPFGPYQKDSFTKWLTWQRKCFQTWLYTRNKRIKSVFVLNDHKAEDFLNQICNSDIFQMLPDPVPVLMPEPGYNLREQFSIPDNHKIFLHIGSLLKRKGTLDILDSLQYLSQDELSKFTLLILGHAEPDMDQEIRTHLPPLPVSGRGLGGGYVYQNTFLPPQVFKSTLDQSDLVLVPYRYSESSSGIAGHAIAAGKPLLAIRKGLLGDTVAEHGSGIFIDACDPIEIANGLKRALSANLQGKISKRYLQSHTKETFSRLMVAAITR